MVAVSGSVPVTPSVNRPDGECASGAVHSGAKRQRFVRRSRQLFAQPSLYYYTGKYTSGLMLIIKF